MEQGEKTEKEKTASAAPDAVSAASPSTPPAPASRNPKGKNPPAEKQAAGDGANGAAKPAPRSSRPARPGRPDRPARPSRSSGPVNQAGATAEEPRAPFGDDDDAGEETPRTPLSSLDPQVVTAAAGEVIARLVEPILGPGTPEVQIEGENLRVAVNAGDDPGLLIGREGQTLAAIQYLATRMLANKLHCRVKLHVDAGDYRQRQDDRLRELALSLADKVRATRKPQLTRPLSSYQRRVIHMTLQDDAEVQTHSKGEGELKRVVIAIKKK